MFERLEVRNIEAHESFVVVFDKVTTFIGPSDCGKSALLRLLRWICLNEPAGTAFIRWGAPSGGGKLWVDGHTVLRKAGEKNVYKYDGGVYAAFGRDVPADIANMLNVSELNFQRQTEGQFWLCQSAPQVSRELNAIIDLGIIDETLARAAATCRIRKAAVTVSRERLDKALARKEQLQHAPAVLAKWEQARIAREAQDATSKRVQALSALLEQASDVSRRGHAAQAVYEAAIAAQDAARKASEAAGRRSALQGLCASSEAFLGVLERPTLTDVHVQSTFSTWQTCRKRCDALGALLGELSTWQAKCQALKEKSDDLQRQATAALGSSCPLCSQPIPTKTCAES